MKKVLICDDEIKVAQLVAHLVGSLSLDLEISGIAHDGFAALNEIRNIQPDIVITDIMMPGINGIELIAQAKEIAPQIRFIIISGYKNFEFAHSAIKYGVEDYLLKPIDEDELLDTLRKILNQTRAEEDKARATSELESQLSRKSSSLRTMLLPTILNSSLPYSRERLNADFSADFSESSRYMMTLFKPALPLSETPEAFSLLIQKIQLLINRQFSSRFPNYFVHIVPEGLYVLVNFSAGEEDSIRSSCQNVLLETQMLLDIFPKMKCCIGQSRISDRPEEIRLLAREAKEAAFEQYVIRGQKLIPFSELPQHAGDPVRLNNAMEERLLDSVNMLDSQKFALVLKDFHNALDLSRPRGLDAFSFCLNIYDRLLPSLTALSLSERSENLHEFETHMYRLGSVNDLFELITSTTSESINRKKEQKEAESSQPIQAIQEYIEQNYDQNISLDLLSEKFGYNAVYISQLFKHDTNINLKDYLLEVRMKNAKKLLRSTDLDMDDVAQKVGYSDPKYFAKLFKTATGLSPKNFRKLYHV